jgi:methylmalonyl-CoA mutase
MNSLSDENLFMRSFASRDSGREIADCIGRSIEACKAVGFDLVVVETSGLDKVMTQLPKLQIFLCM